MNACSAQRAPVTGRGAHRIREVRRPHARAAVRVSSARDETRGALGAARDDRIDDGPVADLTPGAPYAPRYSLLRALQYAVDLLGRLDGGAVERQQLVERAELQRLLRHGPRTGEHFRVLHGRLDLERVRIHAPIALGDVQR